MSEREEALADALSACLDFMCTEMHWEFFRAEFLNFDDEPKKRVSEDNARKLKNFLAKPEIKKYIKEFLP